MKTRLIAALSLGLATASFAALPLAAKADQPNTTDYNYVGLGVGVGDIGNSDVGLAVNSKITIGQNVSVRPGVISDLNFTNNGDRKSVV